jgi:hypothetical protein
MSYRSKPQTLRPMEAAESPIGAFRALVRNADHTTKWQRTIVILERRLWTVTDYASTR